MTAELRALTDELRGTNALLTRVTNRLDAADRQHRRHRFSSVVLALLVVWVGVDGWREDEAACRRANEARADIRAGIVETVLVIVEESEQPAELAPLVERIQDRLEVTIPDHRC
jgi:hypothetical protein